MAAGRERPKAGRFPQNQSCRGLALHGRRRPCHAAQRDDLFPGGDQEEDIEGHPRNTAARWISLPRHRLDHHQSRFLLQKRALRKCKLLPPGGPGSLSLTWLPAKSKIKTKPETQRKRRKRRFFGGCYADRMFSRDSEMMPVRRQCT